ncbi:MAG: MFS transporter [Burkholderiaceae bacterium]|nr:MFS transporter [Burkholderiaceae bacterium]MCX7901551.1 MFS transporter [Burkholderiaceae bacterium]
MQDAPARHWRAAFAVYRQPAVLRMLLLGFAAGLPLLLVLGTLSFRLREAGIGRAAIGYLSWVGLVYGMKWAWAPLVDRLPLPFLTRRLGRRRAWLLLAQLLIVLGLAGMALADPQRSLAALAACALLVAFASATQDIALDAYRIECAPPEQQGALAAAYQAGYRLAMIWTGAGALWIAARAADGAAGYAPQAWTVAYLAMAASMAVGVVTVLLAPEPPARTAQADAAERALAEHLARQRGLPAPLARFAAWAHQAFVGPFMDFLRRYRAQAVLLLALIATYRVADVVMGVMANPFYVDMGYSKDEVAAVSKFYGVAMTLAGAILGGAAAVRYGVLRVLAAGALLSAASNLLFAWLATRGHDLPALVLVIGADNLSAGVASAAFVAYLSGLTNVAYSATQYALFSSTMLLVPKWLAGFSGAFVDAYGYPAFFAGTAALGLPVLLLIALIARTPYRDSKR